MKYDKIEPKDNMNVTNKKEVDKDIIRPKMERIVMTDPVKPKRGLFSRLIHGAFGPDGFRKIGAYIGQDIILPAIKNIVADSITSGINMALFGENHPPRSGLDGKTIKTILKVKPKKLVYISCNPDTLVDNLLLLEKDYDIKAVQPVDMFPFTSHVECVTVLERKNIEK